MKEKQYFLICDACDRLLLADNAERDRVAISWLHVVREHPVFLSKYQDLVETPGVITRLRNTVAGWFRIISGLLWQLVKSTGSTGEYWGGADTHGLGFDTLFISHLVSEERAGVEEDFYFGDLPKSLLMDGQKVAVAMLNHTNTSSTTLSRKWNGGGVEHLVLAKTLKLSKELSIIGRLIKQFWNLKKDSWSYNNNFLGKAAARSAREALSAESRATLRIAEQVNELVRRYRPGAIVVTYEGHAWERMAFSMARMAKPSIKCIAYQHAALFRLQHGIRRRLQPEFNPDYILTCGTVSKRQLLNDNKYPETPVSVLGSSRAIVNALPSGRIKDSQDDQNPAATFLVIPEGIESECNILFEFSLDCAIKNPDARFIWRLHPIISFEHLTKRNPNLRQLPENIMLSRNTLEQDIGCSRFAIYRGSTAIIQAVMNGVQPIYYHRDGMTLDPLFELDVWRRVITKPEDLALLLEGDAEVAASQRDEAIAYCSLFYEKLNPDVLLNILN